MGAIGFYIFYGINWVVTFLPMRILYVFSDFLYLILILCSGIQEEGSC